MFLVNSRLDRFAATLSSFKSKFLHSTRVPLLPKLRGYFAEFLRESYLAHLSIFYQPTCGGFRYGYPLISRAKIFLAVWSQHLRGKPLLITPHVITLERIFLLKLATRLNKHIRSLACLSSCVPPLLITNNNQYGNINPLSIAYAFQPELRFRLTPRGRACRGKP